MRTDREVRKDVRGRKNKGLILVSSLDYDPLRKRCIKIES